jgi:hypothetical protein
MQYYLRKGVNSMAVKPIEKENFTEILENYGRQFSNLMNAIYKKNGRAFYLTDVLKLGDSIISVVFKYDSKNNDIKFHDDFSDLDININNMIRKKISSNLEVSRVIKLYPCQDVIVFVKPNQLRYWISLAAYRDADKCLADFARRGF